MSVVAPLGVKSGPQSTVFGFRLRVLMTGMESNNLKTPHGDNEGHEENQSHTIYTKKRVVVILVLGTLVPFETIKNFLDFQTAFFSSGLGAFALGFWYTLIVNTF